MTGLNLQEGRTTIELVARFEHQVTGVTVSEDNRIFVNFPRWTEDTAVSVAELLPGGELQAYPDDEWNAWRNANKDDVTPDEHWVCVAGGRLAVLAGDQGRHAVPHRHERDDFAHPGLELLQARCPRRAAHRQYQAGILYRAMPAGF